MDIQRKKFWLTLLRVFLVSLIMGLVAPWVGSFFKSPFIVLVLLIILIIYGLVEACKVFKTRAAIRKSVTRDADYFFAVMRFIAIIIPPIAVGAFLGMVWLMYSWAKSGYHG